MKKIMYAILLLSLSLFFMMGCGKSNEPNSSDNEGWEDDSDSDYDEDSDSEDDYEYNDDDNSDISNDNDDTAGVTNQYLAFDGASDVIERFKEFGYVYNTKEPDSEVRTWSFHYESLGTETVEGVETEHLKITMVENDETKVTEGWYNETWEAVKVISYDGTEKTGLDAAFEGGILTMYTNLYCNKLLIDLSIFSDEGVLDDFMYEYGDKSSESIDLGNGSIDMELNKITVKMGEYNKLMGSVPMDGKSFLVVMEMVGKEIDALDGMRVTRAIPR